MSVFNEEELARYSRHIVLQDFGVEGQRRLADSRVLIIGVGGLGSPAALYLAAVGVKEIGIVDGDVVETSNLHRQIIHTTPEIGKEKVQSALWKMSALNPNVNVSTYHTRVDKSNISELIEPYDFVMDCTDNFTIKFLINEACVLANKPFSHGGVSQWSGQTMTIKPRKTACYACVFNAPPPVEAVPTTAVVGLVGVIPGILGTIQVAEAIKVLTGVGEPLYNSLLTFNAKDMSFRKVAVNKNSQCPVCGAT
ncbi:molybdopterin-synthase adenylyltransferase MoeB [Deferribacterales bacterium RsTz2092]|nr:adenylyltransferase [Deferribacterales bacterium]